jgi:hypothetical protein
MTGQHRARGFAPLAAALAAFAFGCSHASTVGVLGRGQFQYLCSTAADAHCGTSEPKQIDLPGAIAVGATFAISYAPESSNGSSTVQGATGYQIVPASAEFAAATDTTIVARRAGLVALLAEHVGNADVDDFVHIKFASIQALAANPSSFTLGAGETRTVRLEASDAVGAPLAGELACQWQAMSGGSSVALEVLSMGGAATLRGIAGGAATIRATCGSATADISVTIAGGIANDGGIND